MQYKDLFSRYGCYSESTSHTINVTARDPDKLTQLDDIARYDRWAAKSIDELNAYLEVLKEYRQHLARRYGELVTMPYTLHMEAQRRKDYNNHVQFTIWIYKIFEDGTRQEAERYHYPGKERRDAFKKIEQLRKLHPGMTEKLSLEKAAWER